jgi:phytoene/squalene synthetase
MVAPSIRDHIYNIYGFVRLADEIVDTFHSHDKERLLHDLERDMWLAIKEGISINPVLHSFQDTVRKFQINDELISAFLSSMKMDLVKSDYSTVQEYEEYIYGSADVVGLMCLKVFVKGDEALYEELKYSAMKLGSAFQKVNFLRDFKADMEGLERSYFPNIGLNSMSSESKKEIIAEIELDFIEAYKGIVRLPAEARFGVYTAYRYYKTLLNKLKETPFEKLSEQRVRVGNHVKLSILARSFVRIRLNIL